MSSFALVAPLSTPASSLGWAGVWKTGEIAQLAEKSEKSPLLGSSR